jgi:hypothetical protein
MVIEWPYLFGLFVGIERSGMGSGLKLLLWETEIEIQRKQKEQK